jgi:hypothetical protein
MSSTKGGHVVCIVARKQGELPSELSQVKVESTIAYSVFERPLKPAYHVFDNSVGPTPEDRKFWERYLKLLPEYLESGKIKPNRAKELGGLEDIISGFQLQKEGKLSAEKLVYKIAS